MLGREHGGCGRDERAERGWERGQPDASRPQAHVRGELSRDHVHPAEDLRCPVGE
jgi:hypothetical protein